MMEGVRIVIVGAGIAGLAAARALAARGHAITVLERAHSPGGRVATRRITNVEADRSEFASLAFDAGAQYVTVRDERFEREVQQWHKARVVSVWHGTLAAFDSEGREAVEDEVTRWVGAPGMHAIPRHLARGLDVRCGVEVVALGRSADSSWTVTTAAGRSAEGFDAIVLAVPAPEVVRLLGDDEVRLKPDTTGASQSESHDPIGEAAAGSLSHRKPCSYTVSRGFRSDREPAVSTPSTDIRPKPGAAIVREAAAVRMRSCWAALVAFDARVPTRFDGAFVTSSPLGWIARDRSKPQRGHVETWVLHATTAWSDAHAADRPDAIGPFLLNAFADLVRGAMPKPVFLTALRWRHATADPPLALGPLVDGHSRLAVCGDWCRGTRIEDAWVSGVEAAARLVD
jgi:hypothetical protein